MKKKPAANLCYLCGKPPITVPVLAGDEWVPGPHPEVTPALGRALSAALVEARRSATRKGEPPTFTLCCAACLVLPAEFPAKEPDVLKAWHAASPVEGVIFLVCGRCGTWADLNEWPVKAWPGVEAAEKHVRLAEDAARRIWTAAPPEERGRKSVEDLNEYDPDMWWDSREPTRYRVVRIPASLFKI